MKNELRKTIRMIRKGLDKRTTEEYAESLLDVFLKKEFAKFKKIMAYIPIENEADPTLIMKYCLEKGLDVFVPCLSDKHEIYPCRLRGMNDLTLGKYNIPEPPSKETVSKELISLILVPGVAFDMSGNRIGYGKGYYDRFLRGLDAVKIGVCYDFQIIQKGIEASQADVPMDYLLAGKGLFEVNHAL